MVYRYKTVIDKKITSRIFVTFTLDNKISTNEDYWRKQYVDPGIKKIRIIVAFYEFLSIDENSNLICPRSSFGQYILKIYLEKLARYKSSLKIRNTFDNWAQSNEKNQSWQLK